MARTIGYIKAQVHVTVGDAEPVLLANLHLPIRTTLASTTERAENGNVHYSLAIDMKDLSETLREIFTAAEEKAATE